MVILPADAPRTPPPILPPPKLPFADRWAGRHLRLGENPTWAAWVKEVVFLVRGR